MHWYVLRSKPRKEEIVYRQVRNQGFDVYYPRLKIVPINPRSRKVKPYFPGYMFVQGDVENIGLSVFQWMPHTLGLVYIGDEPAVVPDNILTEIKKRVDQITESGGELFEGLIHGKPVLISDGPFAGYEAIFDTRIPGSERVRVLVQLLNDKRLIPLELRAGQLSRQK